MFKNYLKTAFRNLSRNKVFSFINIAGLAIGMAAAILIGLLAMTGFIAIKIHCINCLTAPITRVISIRGM